MIKYRRECEDCGNILHYTDEDAYICCSKCGMIIENPHYNKKDPIRNYNKKRKKKVPVWVYPIAILGIFIFAFGLYFAIPISISEEVAADILNTSLTNMFGYVYDTFTLELSGAERNWTGNTEYNIVYSYNNKGDVYFEMEKTVTKYGDSSSEVFYYYLNKEDMCQYYYEKDSAGITAKSDNLTKSQYDSIRQHFLNTVLSNISISDLTVNKNQIVSARRHGFLTFIETSENNEIVQYTIILDKYVMIVETSNMTIKTSFRFKSPKFDKSLF